MDRTIISWNLPNLITIPLMAFVSFLIAGLIWQLVMKQTGGGGGSSSAGSPPPANNSAGW